MHGPAVRQLVLPMHDVPELIEALAVSPTIERAARELRLKTDELCVQLARERIAPVQLGDVPIIFHHPRQAGPT